MNWEGYEVEGQMDISEFLDDKGASMTENEAIKAIEHDLEWHSKELQPKYKEVLRYTIQILEEIQQYRAIGTVEELKALKEKSEPKKPIRKPNADMTHEEVTCPSCGRYVSDYTNEVYCNCGQKLDWE